MRQLSSVTCQLLTSVRSLRIEYAESLCKFGEEEGGATVFFILLCVDDVLKFFF